MSRSFLFLQGPHGPFFRHLGRRLADLGHRVSRVNFNGGDVCDWPGPAAIWFRDKPGAWPAFLQRLVSERSITDLVLYGDCRPYHRQAIDGLRPLAVRVHVFEEGYLRPDWITLERDGVNGHSHLCHTAAGILPLDEDAETGEPRPLFEPTTPAMVRACVRHSAVRALLTPLFPHFRSHRPQPPLREIAGWLRRSLRQPLSRRDRARQIAAVLDDPRPMFLLPLQLDSDAQIRFHSTFAGMGQVLETVIGSFARAAPRGTRLVIKNHPLDNGLIDYAELTASVAAANGVAARVFFIDGGHLPTLLRAARGVVTVNSTVGMQALHHGCPTKVLGEAIYDRPRLTDGKPLPGFWWAPQPPDAEVYRRFRRFLLKRCQFNGSFYTREGRDRLLPAIVGRLTEAAAGTTLPRAVPLPCSRAEGAPPPILPLPA